MNERIKELVHQTDAWCDQNFPANWTDDVDQYLPLWNAKFAKLIVIECAKIASDSVIDHSGHSETNICPKYLACHIKDHFGVEE